MVIYIKKWTQQAEFKSWMKLFAQFHIDAFGKGLNSSLLPQIIGK